MSPSPPQLTKVQYVEMLRSARTSDDLASILGISAKQLTRLAYRVPPEAKYRSFTIPKRDGGTRTIEAPLPQLRYAQRRLARALSALYEPFTKACVHGFVSGRGIKTNAERHLGRRWVLNIDISNFFPTIHFGRVKGMLIAAPYELATGVANIIANLCCHRGCLPQGAPTSPVLANMVCGSLDRDLITLAEIHHMRVTRFADDITFSTRGEFPSAIAEAESEGGALVVRLGPALLDTLSHNGFTVNTKKVRLQSRQCRQEVTGITVNVRANLQRHFPASIRAMLHDWGASGYAVAQANHVERWRLTQEKVSLRRVLEGKLAYLEMIRGRADHRCKRLRARFTELSLTRISDAIWVVLAGTRQGTGFFLAKIGFVTCYHVLQGASTAEIFRPDSPERRYRISVRKAHRDPDLAICDVSELYRPHRLHPSKIHADVGTEISLWGYNNWSEGSTIANHRGSVSQRRMHFKHHECVTLSTPIVTGGSGGPLLDTDGHVLGVAIKGVKDNGEPDHDSRVILLSALSFVAHQGSDYVELSDEALSSTHRGILGHIRRWWRTLTTHLCRLITTVLRTAKDWMAQG